MPTPDTGGRPGLPPMVDDGLPTLPTGEPVLARWFVLVMIGLVVAGIGVLVWAWLSIDRPELPAAERRPPGDAQVTHDRGEAALNQITEVERGPGCAASIEMIGDSGARAAGRRALTATCWLLGEGDGDFDRFPAATAGMAAWIANDGLLRFAIFERSGVESSARYENGRLVVELNAKFQFEDAMRAAPAIIHQLALLGVPDFPGTPISAEAELAATREQGVACDALPMGDQPPRGCLDVQELLTDDDPLGLLIDAGYRSDPR